MAFVNFGVAVANPGLWLNWADREALARFIYYGASVEFFFVVLTAFLVLTGVGMARRSVMWGMVRGLEGFANGIGRFVAWFGLLMVLQQIVIIFLQRIFRVATLEFGPFAPFGYPLLPGPSFLRDLSWWSEELKLYNAMIVCLCITYTFVQGGHVRVDLLYANVRFRTRRVIDMAGCLLFMMPAAVLTWLYSWYFMWRSLVTPKVSASDKLESLLAKARIFKWNVETIAFSPNGFDAYFLFKLLMIAFCALVFIHAWAFFWRSYLEFVEGPAAEGRYLDRDAPGGSTQDLQSR
ncbi:TRAP transporter small permease subunit [Pseudotabrizicola alkalilacus]|uniref:TRAP transporter small permease protein n=1 Tax=Pseudotabrizicola alkalilacus TaxID=2305252 RepID=A0A411Z1V8_9RHOB|nr:TRAP transporter small permease subunit [Pseudotabrizicola alkalilacus]RGP37046.1 TRAP transporter small permease subunit [Pseudotabrizicola alkalilacus]